MSLATLSSRASTPARVGALVSIVSVAGLALAGCADSSSAADGGSSDDTVTMATEPWLGYGPWYIAQDEGYFEDQGVDVDLVSFDTDADGAAALASGRVDIANLATQEVLRLIESGMDLKVVLLLDASRTADAILTDPSITSVEQLAGKEVAFEEGSVSHLLLNDALASAGLTLDDIVPVPMPAAEAATALASGKVPAAVTYEPYISEAAGAGEFTQLYTAAENEGLISDVIVVTQEALDEKPEAIQAVVDAWAPAIDFYDSNTEEAQQIIADNIGSSRDDLVSAFEGVHYYTLEENKTFLGGEYAERIFPLVDEAATSAGIVEGKTEDLGGLVDTQFVE